ncbi:hypothetical protein R4Z09_25710 [Niallia oryzisoli]|uniref:Flagellar hook-length control protein-like C-terminal domain-containing protein n=1 Tax=Niallia oryzisoli TaxID=1737571 RepID=A0ABZ2CHN6_9BACI
MQVNNQTIRQQQPALSETPLELKQGEVVRATIKETLSDTDAILQIRGKEVRARFSEGVPVSGKAVTIQVNGQADGMLQAKTIAEETTKTPFAEEKIFASAGLTGKESAGVKQAVRILLDKGLSVSKETVQELDSFIEKAQGTLEEKIDTVRALANKRLEATGTQLRAVHEALHGRPLNEVLSDIAKEIDPEFKLEKQQIQAQSTDLAIRSSSKSSREILETGPDLKKVIQQIKESIQRISNPEQAQNIEKAAQEAEKLQKIGRQRLIEALIKEGLQSKEVINQIKNEPDINKVLQKIQDLLKNMNPEAARNIERLALQAKQLEQAGRDRIFNMLQQEGEPANKVGSQMTQALQQLQKEPDLEKAIDQMRKEITSLPSNSAKTIENAIDQAHQLLSKGRELAARQLLSKELSNMDQSSVKTESQIESASQPYDVNELLQSLNLQSKDILVTKVTQKLSQFTHGFRELKREITRNLDSAERVIQTFKQNAAPQAKQILENTISKLDHAILKSEMMLFTDMKTEKQLMQASTQLAEAKKLLTKGDHTEAVRIVSEVKTLVDKMIFKPAEQKIIHYVNKENLLLGESSPIKQMLSSFSDATYGTNPNQEPSARQMYDAVRSLGLNHESDQANSLVFHKNDHSLQEHQNVKAALMKLAQGEGQEINPKIVQQAEQALTNITGQQLLSKSDGSGTLQSMFLNLPLLLGGKPENFQVFINSKNEGQQVEWENCSLYFLLDTKKLGDVGILLNSNDRNLSITIKNDLPGFKEKMEPLAAITKEKLQEVGYNITGIHFTKMNLEQSKAVEQSGQEAKQTSTTRQAFTKKGVDFTI